MLATLSNRNSVFHLVFFNKHKEDGIPWKLMYHLSPCGHTDTHRDTRIYLLENEKPNISMYINRH